MATKMLMSARVRFLVLFIATFSCLQLAFVASDGSSLQRRLIDDVTVRPAAHLIDVVYPQDHVLASGPSLLSQRVRLNVLRGCEGTEAMFLLIAAVLAFPASRRSKIKALLVGCLIAYCANQLRILALYAVARDGRHWFELVHGYLAPGLMVLSIGLYFTLWIEGNLSSRTPVEV